MGGVNPGNWPGPGKPAAHADASVQPAAFYGRLPLSPGGPATGLADAPGGSRLAGVSRPEGEILLSRTGSNVRIGRRGDAPADPPLRYRRGDCVQRHPGRGRGFGATLPIS